MSKMAKQVMSERGEPVKSMAAAKPGMSEQSKQVKDVSKVPVLGGLVMSGRGEPVKSKVSVLKEQVRSKLAKHVKSEKEEQVGSVKSGLSKQHK